MLSEATNDPAAVLVTRYKFHDVAAGLVLIEAGGMSVWDVEAKSMCPHNQMYECALAGTPLLIGTASAVEDLARQL